MASGKKNDLWTTHQLRKITTPTRVPGGQNGTLEQTEQMIIVHFFPRGDNSTGKTAPKRHDIGQEHELIWIGEVNVGLAKCSNTSAAWPDQVPYGVWKVIHLVNQKVIPILVQNMLVWGIHPPMLKESTGVILPKPNKTDYMDSASFRVIALIQMFPKIAKRIINNKLMAIAYSKGLYCLNQTGSLPQRSTSIQQSHYNTL